VCRIASVGETWKLTSSQAITCKTVNRAGDSEFADSHDRGSRKIKGAYKFVQIEVICDVESQNYHHDVYLIPSMQECYFSKEENAMLCKEDVKESRRKAHYSCHAMHINPICTNFIP
jgi:hypothetical protein